MVREATLVAETERPISFTCANGTGIEKGAILSLADPMTAALSVGTNDQVSGIAASEKIASDGKTKLGVYRRGIFRVSACGAVLVGHAVSTGAATLGNYVMQAAATASGAAVIGHALETAADEETFLISLDVGSGGGQIS